MAKIKWLERIVVAVTNVVGDVVETLSPDKPSSDIFILKCSRCGAKNRLRKGLRGATCGRCKTPLNISVN